MSFQRGDVLIARFPNADGSPAKPRPVLVVQSDVYNAKINNLIVAAITNLKHATDPASLLIDVSLPDGQATGLRQNSIVSCINLATIDSSLVAKKIGELPVVLLRQIDGCLRIALGM